MRKALPDTAGDSGGISTPAPTGGWDAKNPLAKMPSNNAVYLDNWIPGTTKVSLRKGSANKATINPAVTPITKFIRSLMGCALASGGYKLFAANDDGIYDVTAGGAVTIIASAATTSVFQSLQLTVGGIPYMYAVAGDGVNAARYYKGDDDTWHLLGTATTPIALTGVVSVDIANVSLWKNRTIFCCRNSLSFWYGPLNSVGGAFAEFPLGAIFPRGGYIMATANWTVDAGNGVDDRFIVITSEGEVAVYQGTDPSDADNFSLVGVYHVGRPVGRRCFITLAGDVGVLVDQGLFPLSKALLSSTLDRSVALTDMIVNAFNAYYQLYKNEFGWQPVLHTPENLILVNVPLKLSRSYQFVMNTQNGAWCRFLNWNADCLLSIGGDFFFARANTVYQGFVGRSDRSAAITAIGKTAFQYLGDRSHGKHIKLVRANMTTGSSNITVGLAIDTDFEDKRLFSSTTNFLQNISLYDSAIYNQSVWNGSNVTVNQWKTVANIPGKALSLRVRVSLKDISCEWNVNDFIAERAGLLT